MTNSANKFQIITIDGGAAVGKSSTSKALAERLDLMHVDTGAHYRTLTFMLVRSGAKANDVEIEARLNRHRLETRLEGRSAQLSVDGRVPTNKEIRSPEVNAQVSHFAALLPVRQALFDYQRSQPEVARANGFAGLVMEGRDIGSVIFPDADYRFFLHADEATRSVRRAKEGQADAIAERDKMDSTRKAAPLVCPDGAVKVDTSTRTLEEVVEHLIHVIRT